MLRYFYLILCMIILIQSCLCYDYMYDQEPSHKRVQKRGKQFKRKHIVRNFHGRPDRFDVDGKESLEQFDLTSFIQPEESVEDGSLYKTKRNDDSINDLLRHYGISNNYMGKEKYNDDFMNLEENSNSPDLRLRVEESSVNELNEDKGLNKAKSMKKTKSEEMNLGKNTNSYSNQIFGFVGNQQKKSLDSLKHMKIPFFSHKAKSPKPIVPDKKSKIRTTSKKEILPKTKAQSRGRLHDEILKSPYNLIKNSVEKRSYEELLCPVCKRKFLNKKFFPIDDKFDKDMKRDDSPQLDLEPDGFDIKVRTRRQSPQNIRDRQLKELEEVQKKVENVEIPSPVFRTPSRAQNRKENKN